MKNYFFLWVLCINLTCLANEDVGILSQFKEQHVHDLGTCITLPQKLQNCIPDTCIKNHDTIAGSWYTIIINGTNKNNKCYVVSYAFLNDKIISDIEHCWYDRNSLEKAASIANNIINANNQTEIFQAENDWTDLKKNICKTVNME